MHSGRSGEPPARVWLFYIALFLNLGGSALAGLTRFLGIPWLALLSTLVWLIWFALIFTVAMPSADGRLATIHRWFKPLSKMLLAVIAVFAAIEIAGVALAYFGPAPLRNTSLATSIRHSFEPADAMALTQQATENLLDGKNPYTSANIITALDSSPAAFDKTTPLDTGAFAGDFPYPSTEQLKKEWQTALTDPAHPPAELESHQSYPAGSFLLVAPFMAAGIKDIRIAYVLIMLPTLAYTLWRIRPGWRIYFALAVALSVEMWNAVGGGDTSLLVFPFLLLAWLLRERHLWLSALAMGVAIATKQVAWFFLPFYLVFVLRAAGFKKAVGVLSISAAVFAAFNLPFIVMNAGAWLNSVAAPMRDAVFPDGVGLITLVTSGILHITAPGLFAALELLAGIVCLVWYYGNCRRLPHTALALALVPFFFAWRSLWNYFYYADIVLLAAILIEAQKTFTASSAEKSDMI
jgi:Glycosyltransferase family 87